MTDVIELCRESTRIADARPDVIRSLSVEDRETLLRALAHWMIDGDTPALEVALPGLVHRAAVCADPMLRFTDLCDALRERQAFDADPRSYAETHDEGTTGCAVDRLSERLDGQVEDALRTLLVAGAR